MKRTFIFCLLIAASLLLAIGCNENGTTDTTATDTTAITLESVTQVGGVSGTTDTTALTLTFSADPTTLAPSHITLTGATKGVITGSGTTRTLAISDITVGNGGTVSVAIADPKGYSINGSPKTATVYTWTPEYITFNSVTQVGGSSETATTTGLTLSFSADPTTLTANDITLTGATKGTLTGSGTTRTLAISAITVEDGETVSVAIANPKGYSIDGSPKTAVVYKDTKIYLTFSGLRQVGGVSKTADTTALELNFSADPGTLTADDIILTGANKGGALTGSGTTRTIAINVNVSDGQFASVSIKDREGYVITPSKRDVVVYKYTTQSITFNSVTQVGGSSETATTTGLDLSFSADPTTLTANDITLTGATKGALIRSGATITLNISDITVGNGGTVSVAIANPSGYLINGSPKTATVYLLMNVATLEIGDSYRGGKIAYILQPGDPGYVTGETHGLIAAIADLPDKLTWSPRHPAKGDPEPTATGATGKAIGTGSSNTQKIVAHEGVSYYWGSNYAAKRCYDYTNTDTGTGAYSDWYLPSIDELNKLFENKVAIEKFNVSSGGESYYWSSTESSDTEANSRGFIIGGGVDSPHKSYITRRIRPVRSF